MDMTVNWLLPTDKRDFNRMSASVWIRCLQLIPYLEERGIACRINDPGSRADVAVFVRWQDKHAYELARRLRGKGQRIAFDLCVNYFDETGLFEGGYGTPRERVTECARMLDVADVVTCASEFIAGRARDHHAWAVHLPDSIDGRHFRFRKDPDDFRRPTLRAIISATTAKSRELVPILPMLQQRGIPLTVITPTDPEMGGPSRFVPWRYETFPQDILEGEICVAHREVVSPYNRGHSIFKIGVFMAEGVPAIASPVPSYHEIVRDGTGGTLCDSLEEWEGALDRALADRELLVRQSQEARANLEPYYTGRVADRYADVFRKLLDMPPVETGTRGEGIAGRLRRLVTGRTS